ncbi:MAG: hypothetical protein P4L51_06095 [Puia sp.]|nr:hypothetical protein [Puia sp.]
MKHLSKKSWRTSKFFGWTAFFFFSLMLLTAAISCNKSQPNATARPSYPTLQGNRLDSVKHYLRDSLSEPAYDSLDFSNLIVDSASTGGLFLRIPSIGDPVAHRFVLVLTTPGILPLQAAKFLIEQAQTASVQSGGNATRTISGFNGTVTRLALNGSTAYSSPVVNGVVSVLAKSRTVSADAVSGKSTDSDFDGTGEELTEVIITAPNVFDDEVTYIDLADLLGTGGVASLTTYAPANGSGTSLLVNPSNGAVDLPAITLKNYFACFNLIDELNATYAISIFASIPTSDPNLLTDPYGNTGETFFSLSKTEYGETVTQYFGFEPVCASCAENNQQTTTKVVDMSGAPYNARLTVTISPGVFTALQGALNSYSGYNYTASDFNQSLLAYGLFTSSGVPATGLTPNLPGEDEATPNGIYSSIKGMSGNANTSIYTDQNAQMLAGQSHGPCTPPEYGNGLSE